MMVSIEFRIYTNAFTNFNIPAVFSIVGLSLKSTGHLIGSWSLMISHWLFCMQHHIIYLSACDACLEVVIDFK